MIHNASSNESCPACIDDSGLVSLRRVVKVSGVRYVPWAGVCRWCERGQARIGQPYRLVLSRHTAPLVSDYEKDEVEPPARGDVRTTHTAEYAAWQRWNRENYKQRGSRERVAEIVASWSQAAA